jgi:predicted nucleotidyltransferase
MGRQHLPSVGLAGALFSQVQQRVLALLFGQPERSYYGAELIRLVGSGTGAVHRELDRLARSGLVTVTRVGNQKHYRANAQSPIFDELHRLVVKTVGLVEPLREALEPAAGKIRAAFIYGSAAKGTDSAKSDIDLMVIGDDLTYPDLYVTLERAEGTLQRKVNPNFMTPADWKRKLANESPFVLKVKARPKIFIVGSESELAT